MKMFTTSGFLRSLYNFPDLYSIGSKFWSHFKEIIFLTLFCCSDLFPKNNTAIMLFTRCNILG